MYQGYVDQVTRQFVTGWAADPARPDDAVDVVILVDGRKLAQVTCDAPRGDLRGTGAYGAGRHGFQYKFVPPLADDADRRVAVRFADSGRPVENGDAVLRKGAATALPVAPPRPRAFTVAAPAEPAALLRLFSLYEADRGIYELLCRCDFRGVRQAHLDYAAFGEAAAEPPRGGAWNEGAARNRLDDLLHAPRFQENVLAHTLRALPEKRRLCFVHIPKCAGTDLLAHLCARYPFANPRWQEGAWTTREDLFLAVAAFARETAFSDSILVGGHVPLNYYIDAGLLRPSDRAFTVVREPIEVAVSQINYVITRFAADVAAGHAEPDVRDWLSALEIGELPGQMTPQFVSDLGHRALYNSELVAPNPLCHWLGGGDAEAVIARLARYNVEVTNTRHYDAWLAQEWGVTAPTRTNVSTKYLTLSTMAHADLAYVQGLSPEDRKLFDRIDERIAASGRASVMGEDLL